MYAASVVAYRNRIKDGATYQDINHHVLVLEVDDKQSALGVSYEYLEQGYPKEDGWKHDCIVVLIENL